jgi:tRNA(fMet)-specific endonuclease VapC
MRYLLDTSFLLEFVLTKPQVPPRFIQFVQQHDAGISMITLAELYEGAFHRSNPAASVGLIHRSLGTLPVLAVNEVVCLQFAELRAGLRRRGIQHADFDLLIAATSLANDLTLVTRDKGFARIPELRIALV